MTDHATIIAEKTEAYNAAERAVQAIEKEVRHAIAEATARINDDFAARRSAAGFARYEATKALNAAKIAASTANPLIGKKVEKTISRPLSKWSATYKSTTVYGIVEVMTSDSKMPVNMSHWRRPEMGEVFVRLLNKDGTPALKIDNMHGWTECQ